MYAKLFTSIYQGTLRGNSHGLLVFTNLLAHCDKNGEVDMHPRAIAEEVGLTIEQVRAALLVLESPDEESRSPEEDGRRILRKDEHRAWGWTVVNYLKYRSIRDEDDRREQNRLAQERWRNKNKPASAVVDGDKPIQKQKQIQKQIQETHTPVEDPPAPPLTAPVAACVLPQQALDAFNAMRVAGVSDGHAGHPDLLALVTAGAFPAEFQSAAADAVGKGKGFAYAIGALKRQRINAASSLAAMHKGAMPVHETPRQKAAIDRVIAMTGGLLNAREQRPGQVIEDFIDAEPSIRAIR